MKHASFTQSPSDKAVALTAKRFAVTRESGFSLIEVLISVLVLSFGLLGMVGMQAASLQANREARLQSAAVVLAREVAEMIRGNKAVGVLTTSNPYLGAFTSPLAPATTSTCLSVTSTTACANVTEVANSQMTEWLARVDDELPGARVTICNDSAPFDSGGLPQWTCTAATGTNPVMVVKIGWTQGATNRSLTGNSAFVRATRPSVVLPVTAGNTL